MRAVDGDGGTDGRLIQNGRDKECGNPNGSFFPPNGLPASGHHCPQSSIILSYEADGSMVWRVGFHILAVEISEGRP